MRLARELQERAKAPDLEGAGRRAARRAEQIEARLVPDDEAAEVRGVEPVDVLERVEHRESRLAAEEHRGVAAGDVQVDQQRRVGRDLRQRRRDVHGDRRRADAALGADEGEHLAVDRAATCSIRRLIAACSSGTDTRLGHALVDAGAHRLEHHRRIQPRDDQQHAGRGMLPLERRQRRRNLLVVAQVEDHHLGLVRAGLREARERIAWNHHAFHARLAQRLREPCVGTNKLDHLWHSISSTNENDLHATHRTRTMTEPNEPVTVPPVLTASAG